jgi:hypothetical protein
LADPRGPIWQQRGESFEAFEMRVKAAADVARTQDFRPSGGDLHMILKFVTKNGTKVHGYTKKEEATSMAAMPTARLLLRAEPATVKSRSPKHRSIRRRQSHRAPRIREQPRLKRTRTVQDFCSAN